MFIAKTGTLYGCLLYLCFNQGNVCDENSVESLPPYPPTNLVAVIDNRIDGGEGSLTPLDFYPTPTFDFLLFQAPSSIPASARMPVPPSNLHGSNIFQDASRLHLPRRVVHG